MGICRKKIYPSREAAEEAITRLRLTPRPGKVLTAYKCFDDDDETIWHIGNIWISSLKGNDFVHGQT